MFDKYEKGICPFPTIREGQFMESRIHSLPFLSFFLKNFLRTFGFIQANLRVVKGKYRKEDLHHVHLIPKAREHSPENLGQSNHSLLEQWEGATGFRFKKKRGKSEAFPAVFFFRKSLLTALCRKAERSQYDYDITYSKISRRSCT